MQELGLRTAILFSLAVLTYPDIKYKKIPVLALGILAVAAFCYTTAVGDLANPLRFSGASIGLLFCAISFLSRQAIGMGDAVIALILGWCLGIYEQMILLFAAFCLMSVFSVILLICRRAGPKTGIPFLPFLYLAYGGMCLL
ncbi:MAG: prepilin peptidase [Lachnospiraceae bacterium]|nr:prepilin peptidase [Lachnospiraceae bacterium]